MKFLSIKCPRCTVSCLSWTRCLHELIVLRRCWLRWEQSVQCMVRVIQGTAEKAFICLFHQFDNVWHIRWTVVTALTSPYERRLNASTRWRSVPVMKPLHAGDAYVNLDTTTALKTFCRPASFMPWWRRTRRAYSVCALSLTTRRMCSDADMFLLKVTPRTFSVVSQSTSGMQQRRRGGGSLRRRWLS